MSYFFRLAASKSYLNICPAYGNNSPSFNILLSVISNSLYQCSKVPKVTQVTKKFFAFYGSKIDINKNQDRTLQDSVKYYLAI
jgi:hypothetical protein